MHRDFIDWFPQFSPSDFRGRTFDRRFSAHLNSLLFLDRAARLVPPGHVVLMHGEQPTQDDVARDGHRHLLLRRRRLRLQQAGRDERGRREAAVGGRGGGGGRRRDGEQKECRRRQEDFHLR